MKLFGPVARAAAVAGVIAASAMPAFAGPAEVALLESYVGSWTGKGVLTGVQEDTVTCRMQLTRGTGAKVNYTGRCSMAGAQLSVTGTIAYVDAARRYEASMNSGIGGFRGVAVGVKRGDGIVFDLRQRAEDDSGNDVSINSSVTLSGGNAMSVTFRATFNETGDTIDAKVPFSKS